MATLLKVGDTGRARFSDGLWNPAEAPTVKEAAARAGGGGEGTTLLFTAPKQPGHTYEMQERTDPLGNQTLHVFSKRGPTAINPNGSQTTDTATGDRAAEYDRIQAIQDRNRQFWARPNPPRKPTPGAA